ncbi:MAG: DUF1553 domain-containing protein [Pirellulales bacterium]
MFSGPVDGNGRRSMYLMMSIMDPPKFLTAFDLPDLKLPSGRRNITSVPTQALLMLNDPFVDQMAKSWAKQLISVSHRTPHERIEAMFAAGLGRRPSEIELQRWSRLLVEFSGPDELMTNEQAWAQMAHTLFNTKEFIHYR